ncbi:hypothetical protein BC937DRAFT_89948 [Endogone sp. FLAS-F59071]|nr:hypothetical protein BC937DRAFT_89948 [Endogone sp. FLAS-F59071]|eukprot:RUS22221.1 hypothetical protein BC937DRAFT_89948 [Endogone sp. FLAS-F59071]
MSAPDGGGSIRDYIGAPASCSALAACLLLSVSPRLTCYFVTRFVVLRRRAQKEWNDMVRTKSDLVTTSVQRALQVAEEFHVLKQEKDGPMFSEAAMAKYRKELDQEREAKLSEVRRRTGKGDTKRKRKKDKDKKRKSKKKSRKRDESEESENSESESEKSGSERDVKGILSVPVCSFCSATQNITSATAPAPDLILDRGPPSIRAPARVHTETDVVPGPVPYHAPGVVRRLARRTTASGRPRFVVSLNIFHLIFLPKDDAHSVPTSHSAVARAPAPAPARPATPPHTVPRNITIRIGITTTEKRRTIVTCNQRSNIAVTRL